MARDWRGDLTHKRQREVEDGSRPSGKVVGVVVPVHHGEVATMERIGGRGSNLIRRLHLAVMPIVIPRSVALLFCPDRACM